MTALRWLAFVLAASTAAASTTTAATTKASTTKASTTKESTTKAPTTKAPTATTASTTSTAYFTVSNARYLPWGTLNHGDVPGAHRFALAFYNYTNAADEQKVIPSWNKNATTEDFYYAITKGIHTNATAGTCNATTLHGANYNASGLEASWNGQETLNCSATFELEELVQAVGYCSVWMNKHNVSAGCCGLEWAYPGSEHAWWMDLRLSTISATLPIEDIACEWPGVRPSGTLS